MENKWWHYTRYVIVFAVLAAGIYDGAAYALGGWSATISRQLLGAATISPIVPLAIGIVIGHIFWPQPPVDPKKGE